jgi:hypothetical protein
LKNLSNECLKIWFFWDFALPIYVRFLNGVLFSRSMTLQHQGYQIYVDNVDNRPISILRLRKDKMLCLSKFMKRNDCIKFPDEADESSLLGVIAPFMEYENHTCQGIYWHLHLPLQDDLVTIANKDLSNVSIDGMVLNQDEDNKVWLLPALRAHLENQLSDSEMTPEQYILTYGHPLRMEYFRKEEQSPFATAYIDNELGKTIMILQTKCGYAHSNNKKDMAIPIVNKQMSAKREDIERLLPELTPEIINNGVLAEDEEHVSRMLKAIKEINSRWGF